ncbi:MAG: molybdenum cofactor synthesis protein [Bacillales bacterium]|jgi:putative molybdopterin biosynthesis protein|nr:molybdenum cofactor synthesis protein [Bacillales bacterium]
MTKEHKRKIYLEEKPRLEAKNQMLSHFSFARETEQIQTIHALGRVSASPIIAGRSVPHYHASAMDGIAVFAEDTFTAHEKNPLRLDADTFSYVNTGNQIPSSYNAVIMIENVEELSDGSVEIIAPATPWQHIRPIGEDITEEEMLFTQGHTFRPVDIGVLLASGILQVEVVRKPRVAIIPTGLELIQPSEEAVTGKLIEFNGTVFSSYVTQWGGEPLLSVIVTDELEQIKAAILKGTNEADIVVINGGSSAGSKDFTFAAIEELGEVFTHGVACRPGHPVVLGKVNDKIVVGVPGYPVSAYLSFEWFVQPMICAYLGIPEPVRPKIKAKLGRRVVSKMGIEDHVRVNVYKIKDDFIAIPLTRSAGITMSLARADALMIIPPAFIGFEAGEEVELQLLRPLNEISSALAFNGSHDMTLDIVSSLWKKQHVTQMVSTHTGSMAGILAIKKNEAHVAGIHLLDPETGEYNLSYVKRIAANDGLVLQPFLKRSQGWILPKGNPLNIRSIGDIVSTNADYVNRQKGAGTRILLDQLLQKSGVDSTSVKGYHREFFSHLGVAAEVRDSETAVGMGIYSVSKIFDLDFVPVADESYDLLMRREFYESVTGQALMQLLRSDELRNEVEKLGGYEVVADSEPIYI